MMDKCMMTCFSCFRSDKVIPPKYEHVDEEVSGVKNIKLYSYKDLEDATGQFSSACKIGQGGFGAVYKASLRDGTVAAIKVLSAQSTQGVQEFLTGIDTINNIEHENLVKLCGCCIEGSHRILIYGYLDNNSLAQTFLGRRISRLEFIWSKRLAICIGVAKGLAYLHEDIEPYVVHRDIKAGNILLDKDFTAKISDFGLAKLFPDNLTHVSTRVAGTIGYLAPECAIGGRLTRKADVYSFGVLLLEIVCGRPNIDRRLPLQQQYLLEWTWELYQRKELIKLLDTSLEDSFNVVDEACKYLKIGLLCTQEIPKLRPIMSTVVMMLTGEIPLDDVETISKPGLLSEFTIRDKNSKNTPCTSTTDSSEAERQKNSSFTENAETSYATITFNPIYDRTI